MTERQERAFAFFTSGDNCAQSVFKAFADVVGLTEHQAALVSSGFGGGMGRLRQNCGAFSAMVMLCGGMQGPEGTDKENRTEVYALVQAAHRRFLEHFGTTQCYELLGKLKGAEPPRPDDRTAAYYATRPCVKIVLETCQLIEEMQREGKEETVCGR